MPRLLCFLDCKGVFFVWSFSQKHLGQKFGRASSPRLFAEPVATDLEAWVYYQPVNQSGSVQDCLLETDDIC